MKKYIIFTLVAVVALPAVVLAGWSEPLGNPPERNTFAPVNVGATAQIKYGNLGVDNLLGFVGVYSKKFCLTDFNPMDDNNCVFKWADVFNFGGVKSITGGSNVTITSTGPNGTGDVTINSTAISGGDSFWTKVGNDIKNSNTGNVIFGKQIQIKGGAPDKLKILGSMDASGLAKWYTAAELGLGGGGTTIVTPPTPPATPSFAQGAIAGFCQQPWGIGQNQIIAPAKRFDPSQTTGPSYLGHPVQAGGGDIFGCTCESGWLPIIYSNSSAINIKSFVSCIKK